MEKPLGPECRCPNCQSLMNAGDPCPECDHADNEPLCDCEHCMGGAGEDMSFFRPGDLDDN